MTHSDRPEAAHTRPPACIVLACDGTPRARLEVDAEIASTGPGEFVLEGALIHPELPAIVAALVERRVRSRVALDDERLTRPLAARLQALGVVGVEVAIDGLERLHDRVHGLGSWRARLGSLRAARQVGLSARARVRVESTIVDDLPELLALLQPITTDVVLEETGRLALHERVRAIEHGAALARAHWVGFALHGPPPVGDRLPITPELWSTVSQGIRRPHAEVGTIARVSPNLGSVAARAGDLRALGLGLAAMRAAVHDLPLCLGGRGRAASPTTHVASCLQCPQRARCDGMPTELLPLAQGLLQPRRSWRALGAGDAVRILPGDSVAAIDLVIPAITRRFEERGARVTLGEGSVADAALVVAWNYTQALTAIDDPSLASNARVVVGELRMLVGRESIAARAREGWPDERLEVFCPFPSFAHLHRRTGIPLHCITYRPFPIGPFEPRPTARWAFATSGDGNDQALLEAALDRLAHASPTIRVLGDPQRSSSTHAKLVPVGPPSLPMLIDHVARARFVVMPLHWDRDVSIGGLPLVLAHAFGKPIVATRAPMALDHLRDDVDALLVDPGDVEGFALAIKRLHHDEALRARLTEGAVERARAGSAARWADELLDGFAPARHEGPHAWP